MVRGLILVFAIAVASDAVEAPAPPAAPHPTLPIFQSSIHTIVLSPDGQPDQASQQLLDRMVDDGWRGLSSTVISRPGESPTRLAILFSRFNRPAPSLPMRPAPQPQANPAPAPHPPEH